MVPSQKSPLGPHLASLLRLSGRSASGRQKSSSAAGVGIEEVDPVAHRDQRTAAAAEHHGRGEVRHRPASAARRWRATSAAPSWPGCRPTTAACAASSQNGPSPTPSRASTAISIRMPASRSAICARILYDLFLSRHSRLPKLRADRPRPGEGRNREAHPCARLALARGRGRPRPARRPGLASPGTLHLPAPRHADQRVLAGGEEGHGRGLRADPRPTARWSSCSRTATSRSSSTTWKPRSRRTPTASS